VLVTKQTGAEGRKVQTLLISEGAKIKKEFYLAVLLDRENSRPLIMASTEGGMDIEEVANKTPEKILTEQISPLLGVSGFQARKIAFALGLKDKQVGQFATLLAALYRAFVTGSKDLCKYGIEQTGCPSGFRGQLMAQVQVYAMLVGAGQIMPLPPAGNCFFTETFASAESSSALVRLSQIPLNGPLAEKSYAPDHLRTNETPRRLYDIVRENAGNRPLHHAHCRGDCGLRHLRHVPHRAEDLASSGQQVGQYEIRDREH